MLGIKKLLISTWKHTLRQTYKKTAPIIAVLFIKVVNVIASVNKYVNF